MAASSKRIKGITIKIGGDTKPLQTALKDVNDRLSKTETELRDVNKLLKMDPKNTELLQQKQGLLSSAIKDTKEKLEKEKAALEQLKKAGNTEDTQAQQRALEREIADTTQQMKKLAKESEDTNKALKKFDPEKMKKAFNAIGSAAKVAATAAAAVGTAAVAAGKKILDAANETATYGNEVDKMSQKLGLSAEAYQKWDYVLGQADVDINSMTTGLKTLTNKVDDAKNGSESAQQMFQQLGISLQDLNSMSREDIFAATIKGFQGLEDSTGRAALANDMFGKSGQNLTPLFNESAEATEELMRKADELGIVMSDEGVKAAADYQDSMDTLQRTFTGVKNNIMGDLLPSITSITTGLSDLLAGNENASKEIQSGAQSLIENITAAAPKVVNVLTTLGGAVVQQLPKILATLTTVAVPQLLTALTSALPGLLSGLLQLLPIVVNSIAQNVVPSLVTALTDSTPVLLSGALELLMSLVDAIPIIVVEISNAIPQVVESLTAFLTNPANIELLLKSTVTLLMSLVKAVPIVLKNLVVAAGALVKGLGQGMMNGIGAVTSAVDSIKNKITSGISGLIGKARTWAKDMIDNFVQTLRDNLYKVADGAKAIGQKIKDFIGFSEPDYGPLANFHTFAPDMIDLFVKGINDNIPKLQTAVNGMAMTVAGGSTTNNSNVTVNQYNTYANPHSDFELWQSRQSLNRTVHDTVRGAI